MRSIPAREVGIRKPSRQRLTPSSELELFNADGVALAYDKPERMKLDSAERSNPRLAKVTELHSPVLAHLMTQYAISALSRSHRPSLSGWPHSARPAV